MQHVDLVVQLFTNAASRIEMMFCIRVEIKEFAGKL